MWLKSTLRPASAPVLIALKNPCGRGEHNTFLKILRGKQDLREQRTSNLQTHYSRWRKLKPNTGRQTTNRIEGFLLTLTYFHSGSDLKFKSWFEKNIYSKQWTISLHPLIGLLLTWHYEYNLHMPITMKHSVCGL